MKRITKNSDINTQLGDVKTILVSINGEDVE